MARIFQCVIGPTRSISHHTNDERQALAHRRRRPERPSDGQSAPVGGQQLGDFDGHNYE